MLRSLLRNASTSLTETLLFERGGCRSITTLLETARARSLTSSRGKMSDILEILGPPGSFLPPPAVGFHVGLLRKCIKFSDFVQGSAVHVRLIKLGLVREVILCNMLLNLYGKTGLLDEALKLFDEMTMRDSFSWCTLVAAHVSHGLDEEAFRIFKRLCGRELKLNAFVVSSVLNACSAYGDVELGVQIHGQIAKTGLSFDRFVEVGLVDLYAKCGEVNDAVNVFYEIPVKSLVSWNAMLSGYVRNGLLIQAVALCIEMCRVGFLMDLITLRVVASAVAALEMLHFCKNLHVYSIKIGLSADSYVVAEFVRLFAKVGDVDYMRTLFIAVKKPDTSLYSLLISGYHTNNNRVEALSLAEEILHSGFNFNEGLVINILNLCSRKLEGTQIHARVMKSGHGSYIPVGNSLISMYIRFGMMKKAQRKFDEMRVQDEVSWTTILAGHVQNLQFGEALRLFCACTKTGRNLDQFSTSTVINACAGLWAIKEGQQIHSLSLKLGTEVSDFLRVSLLHMYVKCGFLGSASKLFFSMPAPHDLLPVNVMLAGYCWNILPEKAVQLFHSEYQMGWVPDRFSFSILLDACTELKSLEMGEQMHSYITKTGLIVSDIVVGKALANLYVKIGKLDAAMKCFSRMNSFDPDLYGIMIMGYSQQNRIKEALVLFNKMHQCGLYANSMTMVSIIRICTNLVDIKLGQQLHTFIMKMGFVLDNHVNRALVGMYTNCWNILTARKDSCCLPEAKNPLSSTTNDICDIEGKIYCKQSKWIKLEKMQKGGFKHLNALHLSAYSYDDMPIDGYSLQVPVETSSYGGRTSPKNHKKYISRKDPLSIFEMPMNSTFWNVIFSRYPESQSVKVV